MESIAEILEDVKQKMCDNYCKYTEQFDAAGNEDLFESDICKNCPLGRL